MHRRAVCPNLSSDCVEKAFGFMSPCPHCSSRSRSGAPCQAPSVRIASVTSAATSGLTAGLAACPFASGKGRRDTAARQVLGSLILCASFSPWMVRLRRAVHRTSISPFASFGVGGAKSISSRSRSQEAIAGASRTRTRDGRPINGTNSTLVANVVSTWSRKACLVALRLARSLAPLGVVDDQSIRDVVLVDVADVGHRLTTDLF